MDKKPKEKRDDYTVLESVYYEPLKGKRWASFLLEKRSYGPTINYYIHMWPNKEFEITYGRYDILKSMFYVFESIERGKELQKDFLDFLDKKRQKDKYVLASEVTQYLKELSSVSLNSHERRIALDLKAQIEEMVIKRT